MDYLDHPQEPSQRGPSSVLKYRLLPGWRNLLENKDVNLPQLGDNLLRCVSLSWHGPIFIDA